MKNISDEKLFKMCREFGSNALKWRQKFAGLLPEVHRRRLYEKKGFASIFEFAKKLCGMSEEQVRLVLNLEKRFENKPALQKLLLDGEASMNKLARVVSIATPENQEELADKVQLLPNRALETFVRDQQNSKAEVTYQDGFFKPESDPKSLHVQICPQQNSDIVKLRLDPEILKELLELQSKEIDVNSLIRKMLDDRRAEIETEKEKIAEEIISAKSAPRRDEKTSRYIPVKIKKILKKEFGTKCSIQTCKKPSQEIHHTQRFALASTHDPRYMAPLCREHHVIAQTIDVKYHRVRLAAMRI